MLSHRYSGTHTFAGQGTQVQITGSYTYAKHYPEESRVVEYTMNHLNNLKILENVFFTSVTKEGIFR